MSESEREPLLSAAGSSKTCADPSQASVETTPLLSPSDATPRYDGESDRGEGDEAAILSQLTADAISTHSASNKSKPWPSIIAMIVLALLSLTIIVVAFFVPAAVEEYAKQAAVLEPTNLSLESITTNGVRARVQANFRLDAMRVQNEHVRRVGRAVTWIVRELGTEETIVRVYLPGYDSILIGSAAVPRLSISILDGHTTAVDFVADLSPGDADGIRSIANEWLEGKLDVLQVHAKADVHLKSGIIPLGTHSISESLTFEGQSLYRSFASLYLGEKTLF